MIYFATFYFAVNEYFYFDLWELNLFVGQGYSMIYQSEIRER